MSNQSEPLCGAPSSRRTALSITAIVTAALLVFGVPNAASAAEAVPNTPSTDTSGLAVDTPQDAPAEPATPNGLTDAGANLALQLTDDWVPAAVDPQAPDLDETSEDSAGGSADQPADASTDAPATPESGNTEGSPTDLPVDDSVDPAPASQPTKPVPSNVPAPPVPPVAPVTPVAPAPTPAPAPAPAPAPNRAPVSRPTPSITITKPRTHPTPSPRPSSIPRYLGSQQSADATAAAEATRAATAAHARAYTAAQARYTEAKAAYDTAKRDYTSVKAEYDAAVIRADFVHTRAAEAATAADASSRVLGTLLRELTQQGSGTAKVDVLLEARPGADLLYQLSTLDRLAQLNGSTETIHRRADADQKRAQSLLVQDVAAAEAVRSIPLEKSRVALEKAKAALAAASAKLAALRSSARAVMSTVTPLVSVLAAADTGQLSNQGWADPVIGSISDVFGPRPDLPLPNVGAVHYGTDIAAGCGSPIRAATTGVVTAAGPQGTYGNWILIDHGDGIETGYAHIASGGTLVSVGQRVAPGEVIAAVGSTGASTGCHLHFEVRANGTQIDPLPFMEQRGVRLGR